MMDFIVSYAPYLPITISVSILTLIGLRHLTHLICYPLVYPASFQQGKNEISIIRCALNCTVVASAPLLPVLLDVTGAEFSQYIVGYIAATVITVLLISPVLHYIPSPSICYYMKLRFEHNLPYISVRLLNVLTLSSLSVILLTSSVAISTRFLPLSPSMFSTIVGFIAIFSICFGGQIAASSNLFLILTFGSTIGLSYSAFSDKSIDLLETVTINAMNTTRGWGFFSYGFLNGLYLLSSSPLLYQQCFSLKTCRRLQTAMILHVILFITFGIVIMKNPGLYANQKNNFCGNLPLPIVSKDTFPNGLITTTSYTVITLTACIFTLLSLTNIIWEDFLRSRLLHRNVCWNVGSVQICLLLVGTVTIILSNLWIYYDVSLSKGPFILTAICLLTVPLTALYFCAYFIPYTNSKGAFSGFLLGLLTQITYIIIKSYSPFPIRYIDGPCTVKVVNDINTSVEEIIQYYKIGSTTVIAMLSEPSKLFTIILDIPVIQMQLIVFGITILLITVISIVTGGSDFFLLDWHLIICAPYARIFIRRYTITETNKQNCNECDKCAQPVFYRRIATASIGCMTDIYN